MAIIPPRTSKDPLSSEDFRRDWTNDLGADTVLTSAWTVPTGLTKVSEANTTKTATVRLSGGTAGSEYDVVNRITTAGGLTLDFTVRVVVRVMFQVCYKDPDSTEDFGLKWAPVLAADPDPTQTIAASLWVLPANLTNVADAFTTLTTTIRLSGNGTGDAVNKITTGNGQTKPFALRISAREK